MVDSPLISEVTGFPVKRMPGPTRWLHRSLPWVVTAGGSIAFFTGSYIPLIVTVVLGLAMVVVVACHVRCPQCRAPLDVRKLAETKSRRRLYYDCPRCRITWESELVDEDA